MAKKEKIIKKIISYMLIFALCVPVLSFGINPETARAEEILHYALQNGLRWAYTDNNDGTVTLGLKEFRADLAADLIQYNQKYSKPSDIEVPRYLDGKLVTGVGWLLETYVKNIILPDSIRNIYWGAFIHAGAGYGDDFESVTIPGSVEYMEDGCFNLNYKGIIYTTSGSYAEQYAKENSIRYYIIEEPEITIPMVSPVPTLKPTERPVQIVTKRPIIIQDQTTPRPIITTREPVTTPRVTPTARPLITIKPTPTARPEITVTPVPSITNTPKATFTPKPEYTSKPDFTKKETPSPELVYTHEPDVTPEPEYTHKPESTPKPSKTPDIDIQIKINPLELRADSQGKFYNNEVNVSVTGTNNYTVSTGTYSWLKISKENSPLSVSEKITFTGNSDNSFYIFADKNISKSERTGNITITASNDVEKETRTIKIRQEAANTKLSISVSKITANAKGDTSISYVDVKTYNTGGFSVDNCGYSWIKAGNSSSYDKASSSTFFEDEGKIYIFISENTSNKARSGKIKITHENGDAEEIINVSQEGRKTILDLNIESKTADNNGIFYNNAIFVKTSGTGSFTAAVEDADWLKLSSKNISSYFDGLPAITLDDDSYIYLVADKNTGEERTATISITHESGNITKEIEVKQLGKDNSYLYVDRESAYFDEPGQNVSEMVTVSADDNTNWTVTSSNDWIKIIKNTGTQKEQFASVESMGKGSFYILVKENNTYEERSGYITISAPGLEDCEIYVYQAENEISIESLLAELSINVSKKTFKKGKTSKIKLVYPEGLYASDIKSVKFSSNKKKVATVSSKGIIKGIKKGKAVITVKVTLENGNSKTFKAKITIDKRKVKLSKFK